MVAACSGRDRTGIVRENVVGGCRLRAPDWIKWNNATRLVNHLFRVKKELTTAVEVEDSLPRRTERGGPVKGRRDNSGRVVVKDCMVAHCNLPCGEIEHKRGKGRMVR